MKNKIKVRFHLGKGDHYMHWQIKYPNGDKAYYNPNTTYLVLDGCQLHNYEKAAEKIHNGADKTVCAWICCDEVRTKFITDKGIPVSYNPRVHPNWMCEGKVYDGLTVGRIQTIGNKLIII